MVDRVELVLLNQAEQMWKFDSHHRVGLEQGCEAFDEIVKVRNMRHDVVGNDQVWCDARCLEPPRGRHTEECDVRRYAIGLRDLGHIRRRLDAQHRNVPRFEILQQVAVIARDFDHHRAGIELKTTDHVAGIGPRML